MASTVRAALVGELATLNANLARLDATPLVDDAATEALTDEQLAQAVHLTGDHLLAVGRALRGMA